MVTTATIERLVKKITVRSHLKLFSIYFFNKIAAILKILRNDLLLECAPKGLGGNLWHEKSLRKRVSLPASPHYFEIRSKNRKKYIKYKSACLHLHKPAVMLAFLLRKFNKSTHFAIDRRHFFWVDTLCNIRDIVHIQHFLHQYLHEVWLRNSAVKCSQSRPNKEMETCL